MQAGVLYAHSPACASPVLIAVMFSRGALLTPSSTAVALPVPMPLQTDDREVSACTERAAATCTNSSRAYFDYFDLVRP